MSEPYQTQATNTAEAILEGYIAGTGGNRKCPYPEGNLCDAWLKGNKRAWDEAWHELLVECGMEPGTDYTGSESPFGP